MKYYVIKYKDLLYSGEEIRNIMAIKSLLQFKLFDTNKRGWFVKNRKLEITEILHKMAHTPFVTTLDFVDERWNKKEADNWNNYFKDKKMTQENLNKWYNSNMFYPIEIMATNTTANIDWWRFILTVLKKYKNPYNNVILDYGCGTGDIAILTKNWYNKKNSFFVFADISDIMLDITQQRLLLRNIKYTVRCNLKQSNIDNFTNVYDIIFCTDVLEHVSDPFEILEKLNKVSKKETFLFLMHTFSDFENTPYHLKMHQGKGREVGKWLRNNNWRLLQTWFPPTYGKLYVKE